MNRISRESLAGGRNIPVGSSLLQQQQQQRRRERVLVAGGRAARERGDEGLDLFTGNRHSLPISAADGSDGQNVPPDLGRISVGSARLVRSGMDDLLSAADMGKHDYDWLLTPPGTPLFSSSDASEAQLSPVAPTPRNNSSVRSVSTNKTSRFSLPHLENNHHGRPTRSNSVTRSSISTTTYTSSHISSNTNRTSILNTSTASVTSSRSSTPGSCSNTVSATRQLAPTSSRPVTSRSSTPTKRRPTSNPPGDKTKPLHGSRPSSPTSRLHIPTSMSSNSNSTVTRSASRPSTPTRRAPASSSNPTVTHLNSRPSTPTRRAPTSSSNSMVTHSNYRSPTPTRTALVSSSAPVATRSPSVGRTSAMNGRNAGPASRPSSPGPRVKPLTPLVPPDFPLDAPPNLRTKLPERPDSASRTRPGLALTVRTNVNSEAVAPMNSNRRQSSSPVVTRGRLPENSPKVRLHNYGLEASLPEIQKLVVSESAVRKPTKTGTTTGSTGFGRTISKSSLDMALRHMDIRQGIEGFRGTSLFPQSIRSTAPKGRRMSDPVVPIVSNGSCYGTDSEDTDCNRTISTSCNSIESENGNINAKSPGREILVRRTVEPDLFESSRYDALLLKEDSKNMNWLHSVEDKSDQSLVFDHRFELLPEPFGLL